MSVYGKFYQGKLIVETEEMQWTYEVHGNLPRYDPPRAAGKVRVKGAFALCTSRLQLFWALECA